MNINDAFPSKYIKASDLNGKKVPLTISHVVYEDLNGEQKPIIYFDGKEKGLVMNKTNAQHIASKYSPETDVWKGHEIILYPTQTQFNNQMVDTIRIELPMPQADEFDDDIKF